MLDVSVDTLFLKFHIFFENINSARLLEYLPSYNILVKHEKTKEKLESFILDKWASFPDHLILVVEKLVWCVS